MSLKTLGLGYKAPEWASKLQIGHWVILHGSTVSLQASRVSLYRSRTFFCGFKRPTTFRSCGLYDTMESLHGPKAAPRRASTDQFEPRRPQDEHMWPQSEPPELQLELLLLCCEPLLDGPSVFLRLRKNTKYKSTFFSICFIKSYENFFLNFKANLVVYMFRLWNCNQCLCFCLISFELLSSRFCFVYFISSLKLKQFVSSKQVLTFYCRLAFDT
jgi:hypothetical protein